MTTNTVGITTALAVPVAFTEYEKYEICRQEAEFLQMAREHNRQLAEELWEAMQYPCCLSAEEIYEKEAIPCASRFYIPF